MSKHNNTMTVTRMRESILGTTAGVSGAAVLVQTADFCRGSLDPIGREENFGNLNYQPTGITKVRDCIIIALGHPEFQSVEKHSRHDVSSHPASFGLTNARAPSPAPRALSRATEREYSRIRSVVGDNSRRLALLR